MTADFTIAGRPIGPGTPSYVIAELSANHRSTRTSRSSSSTPPHEAGADAVKLQTYTADTITIDGDEPSFRVERRVAVGGPTPLRPLRGGVHAVGVAATAQDARRGSGMDCFSTPFDATAVDFLASARRAGLQDRVVRAGRPAAHPARGRDRQAAGPLDRHGADAGDRRGRRRGPPAGAPEIALLKCTSAYPVARPRT